MHTCRKPRCTPHTAAWHGMAHVYERILLHHAMQHATARRSTPAADPSWPGGAWRGGAGRGMAGRPRTFLHLLQRGAEQARRHPRGGRRVKLGVRAADEHAHDLAHGAAGWAVATTLRRRASLETSNPNRTQLAARTIIPPHQRERVVMMMTSQQPLEVMAAGVKPFACLMQVHSPAVHACIQSAHLDLYDVWVAAALAQRRQRGHGASRGPAAHARAQERSRESHTHGGALPRQ